MCKSATCRSSPAVGTAVATWFNESSMRELNFDGIAGPTHNYAGLSPGNLASTDHAGQIGNPRQAALQGLEKMRFVASLGVGQGVLPPQPRPDVAALRRLGFAGDDATLLERAQRADPLLLRRCSSASAMWAANAASVAPSVDTHDGRAHLVPANLSSLFHRSLETATSTAVLRRVFSSSRHFAVHDALPAGAWFADEGAANHTRLTTPRASLHLFGWGRRAWGSASEPKRFLARQTLEASQAVARLLDVPEQSCIFWQQDPQGIDAGAFHSDVLAVGHERFLMLHELAFVDAPSLIERLRSRLGEEFCAVLAHERELPVADAVSAYPFNSQLVALPSGKMAVVAPLESQENTRARRFFERVVSEDNPVEQTHFIDVNASMNNGGGPACLRLRVTLSDEEQGALGARVILDEALYVELKSWIERHYRDRITLDDLADPALLAEGRQALDELTRILRLGSVYDFQRD